MSSGEGNASRNGTDEHIQTSIPFLKHLMDLFHFIFSISAWLHLNPLKLLNSETRIHECGSLCPQGCSLVVVAVR